MNNKGIIWRKTASKPVYRSSRQSRRFSFANIKDSLPSFKFKNKSRLKRKFRIISLFEKAVFRISAYAVGFIAVGLVVALLYGATRTDYFTVKEISIEGADQTDRARLEEVKAKYYGKNSFTLDLDDIESDFDGLSVYIKEVYARKELPDRVVVEVTERYPKYTVINYSAVYLVDKDYYITQKPIASGISFSAEEMEAYNSNDPNHKLVEAKLKADWEAEHGNGTRESEDQDEDRNVGGDENEGEEFDFSKVSEEKKLEMLKSIKKGVDQIIASYIKETDTQINSSEFAGLPRIYMYEEGNFEEGSVLDSRKMEFTNRVVDYLSAHEEFVIERVEWVTPFTLSIGTKEKKTFLFGINKDVGEQTRDLEIILEELKVKNKKFSRIDVRGENIAVK